MSHAAALLLICVQAMNATAGAAQSNTTRPALSRANANEEVLVVVYVVKPDKRKQFEEYIESFYTALKKVSAADDLVTQSMNTRYLTPAGANEDGTFTYMFLMDPVIKGASYDMRAILEKAMSKAEADRLIKQLEDAIVADKSGGFAMVQSAR